MKYLKTFKMLNEAIGNVFTITFLKLLKKGIDINVMFDGGYKPAESMKNAYEQLKDYIIPNLQNTCIYEINHNKPDTLLFFDHDLRKITSSKKYKIEHLSNNGRYNINTTVTWSMSKSQKEKALNIYKGKNDYSWPFILTDGTCVDIIVSKTGANYTIVSEYGKISPKLFVKLPNFGRSYLKEGWVKLDRLIEIIKLMSKNIQPLYKSNKIMDVDLKTGIFTDDNVDDLD